MNSSVSSIRAMHVYRTYFPDPPGGLQEAIRQICFATQSEGVDNTIFTLSPNPCPNIINRPEGSVVRSRSWMSPASCDIGGIGSVRSFVKCSRQADIVHYLFPWPFADILNGLRNDGTPSILTYISDVVRQRTLAKVYSPLMWRTLRSVRVIVANCPAYAATSPILSDPAIRDKVRIIPLGIVESSYPAIGDYSVFNRLGLSEGEMYFLFIGVLRYYKGLHTLLRSARNIGARIIIAGSGPERTALERMAKDFDASNVIFAGQVTENEKVALIKNSRAVVLPSHLRSEAFGMVLVEAAMLGRPMVSCEIGTGTSYVNAHEKSGLVVPPENEDALADALNVLLKNDELTAELGRGARIRYDNLFSGPALGKAYADLYREVIAG